MTGSRKKKTVAVLFSGGDAPGMNQFLRAFVRLMCNRHGTQVLGVGDGFLGLVRACRRILEGKTTPQQLANSIVNYRSGREVWDQDLVWLDARSVDGLAHRGGVVLGSSRCPEFHSRPTNEATETIYNLYQLQKDISKHRDVMEEDRQIQTADLPDDVSLLDADRELARSKGEQL